MKKVKTRLVTIAHCKHLHNSVIVKQNQRVAVLNPGQHVVSRPPKHTELKSDYFGKWMAMCDDIPGELWPRSVVKKGKREVLHVPVADMHPVQVMRSINWCMRLATTSIMKSPHYYFDMTPAMLLAPSGQWRSLLEAGRLKKVGTVTARDWCGVHGQWFYACECPPPSKLECAPWYQKALEAITYYELDK